MEAKEAVDFWIKASELFESTCSEMDKVWQKRKRILTTQLLVIFILKMVLSKNKQGYGSSLDLLWETCAEKNITLPQINSVAPSSLCEARQKMPESIFLTLNQQLIALWHEHRAMPLWHGHRVFAIDGSKINIPRGLLNAGYKIAKDTTRHYPYGMMSCMYNLQEQIVYDIELVSHGDERSCALAHLTRLSDGDLVIFDRGYFSYLMLYKTMELNLHAVFRMQGGTGNGKVAEFWKSDDEETLIEYEPSVTVKYALKKREHVLDFKPLKMRLIKHKIGNETYVYGTTLIDSSNYPAESFPALYHGRWGIEELYKISKNLIDVEDFHSQTERGVKQELYGHALLINIARLFEADARDRPPQERQSADEPQKTSGNITTPVPRIADPGHPFKINFKNCLSVVGRHLENLLLAPRQLINNWLHQAMNRLSKRKQRVRPGRSYPRISFKPRQRWNSFGATARA